MVNQDTESGLQQTRHSGMIAKSAEMQNVLRQVSQVAGLGATVLLTGESGVGKEVVAQAIHQLGPRKRQPFIKVNCGAIPENLLESELFGYERGSFTGADPRGKAGYFRMANHGVLFLDEIGELPLALQVKLLRVLQESEVTPIGTTVSQSIDVQIVAATNADLAQRVEGGKFRKDLFYRLNVVPIYIPPLRSRLEDVPELVQLFLKQFNQRYNRQLVFTEAAVRELMNDMWLGNVRELEHFIERMVITSDKHELTDRDVVELRPERTVFGQSPIPVIREIIPLQQAVLAVEEQLILLAMDKYKTIKRAALALQVTVPTLSRKHRAIRARLEANRRGATTTKARELALLERELDKQLRMVAVVAASSLDVDDIKKLQDVDDRQHPSHQKLQKQLTRIREREGTIEWAYIWRITGNHQVTNVVSDSKLDMAPGEAYLGPPIMMSAVFQASQGEVVVTETYRDKYGEWKSSLAPIKDEDEQVIAIFGSDYSAAYIHARLSALQELK